MGSDFLTNNPGKNYSQFSDQKLLDAYEKNSGTASLLKTLGRDWNNSDLGRIQGILDKRGIAPGGVDGAGDTTDIPDWSGVFDMTDANQYIRQASIRAARRAANNGGDFDKALNNTSLRLRKELGDKLIENRTAADQKKWNETYGKTYDEGADRLKELQGTAALSASHEQELRSKISGQVQQAKLANLSQVGSVLGLRGVQNSPAAAALAQRSAERYDSQLVAQLRDMGIQTDEVNRNQARADVAASTQIANLRQRSEMAYMAHNTEAMSAIGSSTNELIDSLYARDRTWKLMQAQIDAAEEGGGGGGAGALSGALSGAASGFAATGSPWGALAGGVIGGVGGYMGGGSQVGSSAMQGYGAMQGSSAQSGPRSYSAPSSPAAAYDPEAGGNGMPWPSYSYGSLR